jgi:hypothetical protein
MRSNLHSFRTIIALLHEAEQFSYYDIRKTEEMGFNRYPIPIRDFAAPTLADFKKF